MLISPIAQFSSATLFLPQLVPAEAKTIGYFGGAKYGITKDLDGINGYCHYIQNQYVNGPFTAAQIATTSTCADRAGLSQCAGFYDAVGFVLDRRFLPKWNWYLGTMYSAACLSSRRDPG